MASVNKVILLGRLGKDPECHDSNGMLICRLAIATDRRKKGGEKETEWHNVTLFGRTAEVAQQYLQKGSECYIEGRLHTRSYEKDGITRYATEILGDSMQLGAKQRDDQASGSSFTAKQYAEAKGGRAAPANDDEDIPF